MNAESRQACLLAVLLVVSTGVVAGAGVVAADERAAGAGVLTADEPVTGAGTPTDEPVTGGEQGTDADGEPTAESVAGPTAADLSGLSAGESVTVALVTGEEVTVRATGGQLVYEVTDARGAYETVDDGTGFYLLPESFDGDRYDRELFNVTRLVAGGHYDPETGEIPVVADLAGGVDTSGVDGLSLEDRFDLVDAAAGSVDTDAVGPASGLGPERLAAAGIERLYLDHAFEPLLAESPDEVLAETAREEFDVDGSGVDIAVLDTGIDADHPDLAGRVVYEENFVDDEDTTDDLDGHGTHVAGTAAGDGTESDGTLVGVAPGANLLDMRTCGADGVCTLGALIDGVETAVAEGADIISMSLGGPLDPGNPLNEAVNSAVEEGLVAVTSAGNNGPGFESLSAPGNAERSIAVAADDTLDRFYDEDVAQFSSRGPTEEFRIAPAVTAPGVAIEAPGSQDAGEFPYTEKSGTSMSAPHVSGVVALLLDANEETSPREARSALVTTAERLESAASFNEDLSADAYSAGAGQVDAERALDPTVFVDEPQLGFEFDPFDDLGEERSRNLTVENIDETALSADIAVELEHVEGDSEGIVAVNRTSLDLAPGESAGVQITINASADRPGLYSGYLTLVGETHNHTATVFGYEQPIDTEDAIAVEKFPRDARDVEGDSLRLQTPEGEDNRELAFDEDGLAFFQPDPDAEAYTLITTGRVASTSDPIIVADVIEEPQAADGLTLDENDAVPYEFDLSDIEAERGALLNRLVSASVTSQTQTVFGDTYQSFGVSSLGVGLDHTGTAYLGGPTAEEYGDPLGVNFELQRMVVPEETHEPLETGGIQNERVYNLLTWTAGEDGPVTLPYAEDDLRAVEATYTRDDPETFFQQPEPEAESTFVAVPTFEANTEFGIGGPVLTTFTHELGTRTNQTYYHNVENTVSEFGIGVDYENTVYDGIEHDLSANRTFDPDPGVDSLSFNDHPAPPLVDDEFGTVVNPTNLYQSGSLYTDVVGADDPAQPYGASGDPNTYRVLHEGEVLVEESVGDSYTAFIEEGDEEMPDLAEGDLVAFELEAPALAPIQEHETRYATEYSEDAENEPPEFRRVDLGLDRFNVGATGEVTVDVEVIDHVTGNPDEFAAFYADGDAETTPFDDASGWAEAEVEALGGGVYEVTVEVNKAANGLSLALQAVDAEGSLVETTFYDVATWENEPDLQLTGIEHPDTVGVDESLDIEYTVENFGSATGTESAVELDVAGVDGVQDTDENVTVEPGENVTNTLSFAAVGENFEAGETIEFAVSLADFGGALAGNATVEGPTLELAAIDAPDTVGVDESLEVEYQVENVGTVTGTESAVELDVEGVDGVQDTDENVTVDPGENDTGVLTFEDIHELFGPGETVAFTVSLSDFGDQREGSTQIATPEQGLAFGNQSLDGGAVTVTGVQAGGVESALVLTYPDEGPVVAGLATGTWDDETVTVTVADTGGLSGEHTAHILPAAFLSGEYEPGDSLSGETAEGVLAQATGAVELDVTGDGAGATDTTGDGLLDDVTGDGEFTIADVQALFEQFGSDAVQDNVDLFDFLGDDRVSIFDVQALFDELS